MLVSHVQIGQKAETYCIAKQLFRNVKYIFVSESSRPSFYLMLRIFIFIYPIAWPIFDFLSCNATLLCQVILIFNYAEYLIQMQKPTGETYAVSDE